MVTTRYINSSDIDRIVEIHLEAFADFFLTTLGNSFLKTYYKSLIENVEGIAVCATDKDNFILGFSVGTSNSKGFHRRLVFRNIIRFGFQFMRILAVRPAALIRLLKNMDKSKFKRIDGNHSELLSIAVCNNVKGKGVGNALLKRFELEVQIKNVKIITLTTDYFSNESVIGFYQKAGYEIYSEFTTFPNRKMFKMIKKI